MHIRGQWVMEGLLLQEKMVKLRKINTIFDGFRLLIISHLSSFKSIIWGLESIFDHTCLILIINIFQNKFQTNSRIIYHQTPSSLKAEHHSRCHQRKTFKKLLLSTSHNIEWKVFHSQKIFYFPFNTEHDKHEEV